MRFQYGCENYLNLNQLTIVTVYSSPVIKESEVTTISTKPEEVVDLENG